MEETPAEAVESWGDAPAPAEVEAEAAPIEEVAAEEPFTSTQAEDLLPEEVPVPQHSTDAWESDPAIAGSGAQPEWAKEESKPAQSTAPEPATTYQGPPGFNSVVSKAAPGVQQQQPRSSSRAAQRFKDADGQGVVLPPTVAGGLSSIEMQFGSLSFGGLNGDGVETPVPEVQPDSPVQATSAPAPAPVAASPVRSTQPAASVQSLQQAPAPIASSAPTAPSVPSAPSQPFYSQQSTQQTQAAPATQSQQSYTAPHQTLQQQMQNYQYLQQHQQAPAQSQTQEHAQQQPQQNQYYRQQHDFYNQLGSQPQQTEAQSQQHQQTSQSQQAASSLYDPPFGGFGQQSHLFGQPAQQSQHSQAADPYGAAHRVSKDVSTGKSD